MIDDPAGAERVAEVESGPDAPPGLAPYVLAGLSANHPDLAWKVALERVDRPDFPLLSIQRPSFMPGIAANAWNPVRISELKAYAHQHAGATSPREVEAAISSIELNAKFRAERIPEIDRWLASNAQ